MQFNFCPLCGSACLRPLPEAKAYTCFACRHIFEITDVIADAIEVAGGFQTVADLDAASDSIGAEIREHMRKQGGAN